MKTGTRKLAVFGGTALLALTFGLSGVADATGGGVAAPSSGHSTSVVPASPAPAVSGHPTDSAGSGVHIATLTGCVSGMDC